MSGLERQVRHRPSTRRHDGEVVAALVAGAWRSDAPPPAVDLDEVVQLVPLFAHLGVAALVWWRLRPSVWPPGAPPVWPRLRPSVWPPGAPPVWPRIRARDALPAGLDSLRSAFQWQHLQAGLHESRLERAFATLRAAGLEPVLGKGWAAARLYPDPALRPYGDLDLYLPPGRTESARRALEDASAERAEDLHPGFGELDDRDPATVLDRSRLVPLGDIGVRIFSAEDHLRLLCLHMLRHDVCRPTWLCDVGAALEAAASDFDWDWFLSGNARRTDWALCGLKLAQEVLGARMEGVPARVAARKLPAWMVRAVLERWGDLSFVPAGARAPMASLRRRRGRILEGLRQRWPGPMEATVGVTAPLNGLPRLPFQIAECGRRGLRFVTRSR